MLCHVSGVKLSIRSFVLFYWIRLIFIFLVLMGVELLLCLAVILS